MISFEILPEEQNAVQVRICGSMTIIHASEIFEAVMKVFPDASRIHYDLNGVEEVDVAGLQLICSSHRSSIVAGKEFMISGINREPFLTVMSSLGYIHATSCQPNEKPTCILCEGVM